jgi:excinuclease UvrABC ATPase subunit
MGLGGGNLGGNVLFQGYPIDLLDAAGSYTAEHLRGYLKS